MFLGMLSALLWFLVIKRDRSILLPPLRTGIVLLAFMAVWAVDGLNGALADLRMAHLYAPGNPVRLVTGLLAGITVGIFTVYLLNNVTWKKPLAEPLAGSLEDLTALLVVEGALSLLITFGPPWLLEILAVMSTLGVVLAIWVVVLSVVITVTGRAGTFEGWRQLKWMLLVALAAAALFIVILDAARLLTTRMPPPRW
jgi:hypothetical protein